MPFRKYRELAQWGRYNTRIFKEVYANKLKKSLASYRREKYLEIDDKKARVYDIDELIAELDQRPNKAQFEHPYLAPPKLESHPLYKTKTAYIYDGSEPLSDGIDQACCLFGALRPKPIPENVYATADSIKKLKDIEPHPQIMPPYDLNTLDGQVADLIMHGERYDPTMEKLDLRFDPVLFWIRHPRVFGIPILKRSAIILENLYRKTVLLAIEQDVLNQERNRNTRFNNIANFRVDRDIPFSSCVDISHFEQIPLVIRDESASLTVELPEPNTLWADDQEIEATREQKVKDIYPIGPFIDFKEDNIYSDAPLLTRRILNPNRHLNLLFLARKIDQKYPWTTDQIMGSAIMFGFASAISEFKRSKITNVPTESGLTQEQYADVEEFNKSTNLKRPIVSKVVQIINGKLYLAAVQLNTLDFTNPNEGIKNLVFSEKDLPLYNPGPYYENMKHVQDLNMETFKKLAAFILY